MKKKQSTFNPMPSRLIFHSHGHPCIVCGGPRRRTYSLQGEDIRHLYALCKECERASDLSEVEKIVSNTVIPAS
jgi:hypothetical protein